MLPVSGSVADFYAGRGAGMIPWNLKSQWTENGEVEGRMNPRSEGKGAVMAGEKAAIRRHILGRAENHDVSFVSASRFFRKLRRSRGMNDARRKSAR